MQIILVASFYLLLSIWIISFITCFRMQITCMTGMMAAMALGMSIGLGGGAIIGEYLIDNYLTALVLSLFLGGIVGALAGVPISMMAVLDGLLSGVMGGMMGAMTTVMLPAGSRDHASLIFTVLAAGFIYLLFLLLQGQVRPENLRRASRLFRQPGFMFLFIALSLTIILLHAENADAAKNGPHLNDPHSNHQSMPQPAALHIDADEYEFSPKMITVKVNEPVILTFRNTGRQVHDLDIVKLGLHVHAEAGKMNSMLVTFDKPGTFQAVCTMPGHEQLGMTAIIKVVGEM